MEELIALVDRGCTVTSLLIDGRYVVTVTTTEKCAVGIGNTHEAAWTMMTYHVKELYGS